MAYPSYHRPENASEVSLLLQDAGSRPIAGGTDLLLQMRSGDASPSSLIDLGALDSLGTIRPSPHGGIQIGAMVRLSHLVADPLCQPYPALLEGANSVGSMQVRNRATLVGNICNASPAADTAPALLVYNARVDVVGPTGSRGIPIQQFWSGPGRTALQVGEWVQSVTLPPPLPHGGCYLKLGRTLGMDLAVAGVALVLSSSCVQVALASVAPTPVQAPPIAALPNSPLDRLPADLRAAVHATIEPIDDLRSSASYRRAMALVLLERAWRTAQGRLAEVAASRS